MSILMLTYSVRPKKNELLHRSLPLRLRGWRGGLEIFRFSWKFFGCFGPMELSWANAQIYHMIKAYSGTPDLILLNGIFRYLCVIFDCVSVKENIDRKSQTFFHSLWAPKGMGIQTRLKLAWKKVFLTRSIIPLCHIVRLEGGQKMRTHQ